MNSKFIKKDLPVAVLSAATMSSIFVSCAKNNSSISQGTNPNLSFSDEGENLNLAGEQVEENIGGNQNIQDVIIGVSLSENTGYYEEDGEESRRNLRYQISGNEATVIRAVASDQDGYNRELTNVVVSKIRTPDGKEYKVTKIAPNAFYRCTELREAIFPNVKKIGREAFHRCDSLEHLEVEYVSVIKDFEKIAIDRESIARVRISFCGEEKEDYVDNNIKYELNHRDKTAKIVGVVDESKEINDLNIDIVKVYESEYKITEIGDYAFEGCIGLESVKIGNRVETIGNRAFYECRGIKSVELGANVRTIGWSAFQKCTSLTTDLVIPDNVETIGIYAFMDCSSLESVKIGNRVQTIENSAFERCSGLTSVEIGANVQTIGNRAFKGCTSITSLKLGNNVKTIGQYAFDGCENLKVNLKIPDSVEVIGDYAFSSCGFTGIFVIPNNVTTIGKGALAWCDGLTSIELGANVKTIGEDAFAYCKNLQNIKLLEGKRLYDVQADKILKAEDLLRNRNNSQEIVVFDE